MLTYADVCSLMLTYADVCTLWVCGGVPSHLRSPAAASCSLTHTHTHTQRERGESLRNNFSFVQVVRVLLRAEQVNLQSQDGEGKTALMWYLSLSLYFFVLDNDSNDIYLCYSLIL